MTDPQRSEGAARDTIECLAKVLRSRRRALVKRIEEVDAEIKEWQEERDEATAELETIHDALMHLQVSDKRMLPNPEQLLNCVEQRSEKIVMVKNKKK